MNYNIWHQHCFFFANCAWLIVVAWRTHAWEIVLLRFSLSLRLPKNAQWETTSQFFRHTPAPHLNFGTRCHHLTSTLLLVQLDWSFEGITENSATKCIDRFVASYFSLFRWSMLCLSLDLNLFRKEVVDFILFRLEVSMQWTCWCSHYAHIDCVWSIWW